MQMSKVNFMQMSSCVCQVVTNNINSKGNLFFSVARQQVARKTFTNGSTPNLKILLLINITLSYQNQKNTHL